MNKGNGESVLDCKVLWMSQPCRSLQAWCSAPEFPCGASPSLSAWPLPQTPAALRRDIGPSENEVEGISKITESNLSCSRCRGGTSQEKSQRLLILLRNHFLPFWGCAQGSSWPWGTAGRVSPHMHPSAAQQNHHQTWVFPGGFLLTGGTLPFISLIILCKVLFPLHLQR